jgi:hypothetical protein
MPGDRSSTETWSPQSIVTPIPKKISVKMFLLLIIAVIIVLVIMTLTVVHITVTNSSNGAGGLNVASIETLMNSAGEAIAA